MILSKKMKMSELVEYNFHLLSILSRLGMKGSFADYSVEEMCSRYSIDADTFILICEVYSGREFKPSDDLFRRCRIEDLLKYLHSSHEFYLNSASMRRSRSFRISRAFLKVIRSRGNPLPVSMRCIRI